MSANLRLRPAHRTLGSARKAFTLILVVASAAVQAAGPGGLQTVKPERVGMSSARLARIGEAMQTYIDRSLVPGTLTAVVRKGRLVHFETRGMMDVAAGRPMRPDAIFRIASMTKPITSVALMQLWEQGKFQLRDPVAKFLPEFATPLVSTTADASSNTGELVPAVRPITIRDMLTHTAGLANRYRGADPGYYTQIMATRDGDDLASFVARLAMLPLVYQPGDEWQYSIATDVVGRLVEVISGQPLADYFVKHIYTPLKMTDTAHYLDESKASRLTAQYAPGANGTIELQDPGDAASRWISGPTTLSRGAGGLVSTAGDYLRFQLAMANGGSLDGQRILAPGTVSLMMDNHTGDLDLWLTGPGTGFGLGYGVIVDRGAAATPLSEGSAYWGGAYCTLSWVDRERDIVALLMTQVRPYDHINIRRDFQVLVHQAIIDQD